MASVSYSRVRFRNRWSGGSWSWRPHRHPGWILRRGPHGYEADPDGGPDELKSDEMLRELSAQGVRAADRKMKNPTTLHAWLPTTILLGAPAPTPSTVLCRHPNAPR